MNNDTNNYDVVIVGGGPAGASAAIRLARGGARVLLIEGEDFPRHKLCGEFISPECLAHFTQLGVMDEILASGGGRLTETLFYAPSGRSLRVPSAWLGKHRSASSALGLSRAEMDARLLEGARRAGVVVRTQTRAVGLLIETNRVCGVSVRRDGGVGEETYKAALTVDATGRARALVRHVERQAKSPPPESKRADLVAFKVHLSHARGAEQRCEIYFYRGGYGGLNRVENDLSNLCFIVTAEKVRALGNDAEKIMREVVCANARADETLRDVRAETKWLSVALKDFGRQTLIPATGLATVGDAATFIDPFTGSGMLMALEGGAILAETALPFLRGEMHGVDLTSIANFNRWAEIYRARYDARFARRLRFCAALRRLAFAPNFVAEASVRAFGLSEKVQRYLALGTRLSG